MATSLPELPSSGVDPLPSEGPLLTAATKTGRLGLQARATTRPAGSRETTVVRNTRRCLADHRRILELCMPQSNSSSDTGSHSTAPTAALKNSLPTRSTLFAVAASTCRNCRFICDSLSYVVLRVETGQLESSSSEIFHTRSTPSAPPVARCLPSPLNRAHSIRAVWPSSSIELSVKNGSFVSALFDGRVFESSPPSCPEPVPAGFAREAGGARCDIALASARTEGLMVTVMLEVELGGSGAPHASRRY
mmetsp:Transcript_31509/g.61668  ORF Transcript_31509/g.61668 Transcript_31509/m.61668 type:complete len:249 (+) Transcript_31509:1053-1799(+)